MSFSLALNSLEQVVMRFLREEEALRSSSNALSETLGKEKGSSPMLKLNYPGSQEGG